MNRIFMLLVFCSLFTAFSCSSGNSNKDITKKNEILNTYFPAAPGSKWIYINEAPRDETVLFTVEVKESLWKTDGYNITVSSFPFMTADNTEKRLLINSSGEVTINDYNGASGKFIPSPENFTSGYKWQFGIYSCFISDAAEEIKTEDGNYRDCKYVLMTDGFTFSFEMWYKKGTGIVKWGANRTNPPVLRPVYYVLKEHDIK